MKKFRTKILLICLCAISIAALVSSCLFAYAEEPTDFSREGFPKQSVSASEFLTDIMGFQLSEQEKNYLKSHPIYTFYYNTSIPSGTVETSFDGTNVKVAPSEYSYISVNGKRVAWKPTGVNGVALTDGYVVIPANDDDFVTVFYEATLTADKASVNAMSNQYYNAAKAQSDRLKAHNKQVADYNEYLAKLAEYENVLLPAYQRYLEEYAAWKRLDDPYREYLAEYDRYLAEKDAYDNYDEAEARARYEAEMQRYQEYKSALEDYERRYADYLAELDSPDLVKFRKQLEILDYINAVCENRSLRTAITGNTVSQVLARKEELKIALSVSGLANDAVDKADRATRNLRDLIAKYEACDTDEAKYAFYITCYEQLTENFSDLLRCLDYFYRNDTIKETIVSRGKDLPYRILLAQLYEIVNALDNGTATNYEKKYLIGKPTEGYFDEGYRIGGSTAESILGSCLLADSNDAQPLSGGVPALPEPPVKPAEVSEPKPPARPALPIAPAEVAYPGPAPAAVAQPQKPESVPEPTAYEPTSEETALQKAFDGGLQPRSEVTSDVTFIVKTNIKKYFRNADTVTVYFHRSSTTESYYFAESERSNFAELPTELPVASKTGYTCNFDGWTYADGSDVDWTNLRDGDELHVYPKFVETPNMYDVIWVIDGERHAQKAPFDSIPRYDGIPAKADDPDGRKYRFVGWDRPIVEMTEQTVVYTAQFEASALITWVVEGESTVTPCWKGESPVFPGDTPAKAPAAFYFYTFGGWDAPVAPANDDVTYTARFDATVVMTAEEKPVRIEYSDGACTAVFTANSQTMIDISRLLKIAASRNASVTLYVNDGATVIAYSAADVYEMNNAGVSFYTFSHVQTGFREYEYKLYLYDGERQTAHCDVEVRVTVSDAMNAVNTKLYCADDPDTPLRIQISDGKFGFSLKANRDYYTVTRYSVRISSAAQGILSVDVSENLMHNDVVTVTVHALPVGKVLARIRAVDEAGNELEITDNRFTVGSYDITLFAVLTDAYYTVTFRSDGKVVSTRSYRYGETVKLPPDPFKAPDGEYSYRFVGWDKTPTIVTADAEYNAVFSATPLDLLSDGSLSKEMKLLISFAAIFCAALIALAVALPLLIRRKRRRAALANAENTSSVDSRAADENDDMPSEKQK